VPPLGRTRFDLTGLLWTSVDLICGLVVEPAGFWRGTLGRFAWRTRIIVGTTASRPRDPSRTLAFLLTIAAFMALRYQIPHWGRAWERHVAQQMNRFTSEHGGWPPGE